METFSMRSVVSVSVMMMPFGETVNVTLRNFLALALACGDGNIKAQKMKKKIKILASCLFLAALPL